MQLGRGATDWPTGTPRAAHRCNPANRAKSPDRLAGRSLCKVSHHLRLCSLDTARAEPFEAGLAALLRSPFGGLRRSSGFLCVPCHTLDEA